MVTPPLAAAPQSQHHPHVLPHASPQPSQSAGLTDRIHVKRQVAKETARQLLCIEALLQLSQSKWHGLDLSALLPSFSKPSKPEIVSGLVDSDMRSNATHHRAMQNAMGCPASAAPRPAVTVRGTPCSAAHVTQKIAKTSPKPLAMTPSPDRQAARCSREASEPAAHHSAPPPSQEFAKHDIAGADKSPTGADKSSAGTDKSPENTSRMGLRKGRKRKVSLLDEDPEWALEVLTKEKRKQETRKEQTTPVGRPLAEAHAQLSPNLQNASQHIVQRRGVYFKCVLPS